MSLELDKHIWTLSKGQILPENVVRDLCEKLKETLRDARNVEMVKAPVTVVGSIHGQFYDLLEIFRIGGPPPDTNYLFLGDCINRGQFSVETITLLACLKLRFPERITLLRGRHESRKLTVVYGFYTEVLRKYGTSKVWEYFNDLFDFFPLAAMVENSIFCVHSGISDKIEELDEFKLLDRYQEVPPSSDSVIHQLLWSNPHPTEMGFVRKDSSNDVATDDTSSLWYGADVFRNFITKNSISHMIRTNQLCIDGWQVT
eukprot:TRINITY_DN4208_c0_g1_i1.p1 TRINITY_DN4208_c0_g1~~TRINITY_DN4208_c0_g1_i1.p1  ORF type:complete len:258 (-),score=33.06 TRINITY_DN4208_c0_g1_i1:76-849(-)